jgi:hypothetical protein
MPSIRDFQVAVSFADEDREYVERVVIALCALGVIVFYDADHAVELWGLDLMTSFDDVYRFRSQFVVIFVSRHYVSKQWTRHELRSALARALDEKEEYILPARFDDSDLPGVPSTVRHVDCRRMLPEELAQMIHRKVLRQRAASSGAERRAAGHPLPDVNEMIARAEESARSIVGW